MGSSDNCILILDGNNIAHRARHTFSLSHKGVDTSVTYGFLRILGSLIIRFKATSVISTWDGGIPEFRREAVPEYKANRHHDNEEGYEDFVRQVQELCDYALPMMGVVSVRKLGAEADDLMFHASRLSVNRSIIVTSDKDMIQAVNGNTDVYNSSRDFVYTKENVESEFGVSISDYVEWRALQGDSSDNIPGIMGVGEKTATKLFQEWKSLTGIVNAATGHNPNGKMTGRLAENIALFGFDRIARNIYITALWADRTGARQAVIDAVENFQPADKKRIKKYILRNAFISLLENLFVGSVSKLVKPEIRTEDIRIPVICGRKFPIE